MSPNDTTTTTNDKQRKIGLLSLWAVGRLSFAIKEVSGRIRIFRER